MFGFGELHFESSRAFADDEEENLSETLFGLSVEWTEEGQQFVQGVSHQPYVFCAFEGKVALGFGEGFLLQKEKFSPLGQIFTTGNEGTVDLCSLRPRRKPTARLFAEKGGSVIFALIDFYGVPRFLANDLVQKLLPLIRSASEVVIFHSDISAYYRNEDCCTGKLFYLTSSSFPDKSFGHVVKAEKLRPPNIVSGPSAGILTKCEQIRKPGLLLVTYADTELVDSISLGPFFQAINPNDGSGDKTGFNLSKLFSQFQHNIRQVADISNVYA